MVSFWERVAFALRCFFAILIHARIPIDIQERLSTSSSAGLAPVAPPASAPATKLKPVERPPTDSPDRAVQMLALLQRDGRLIDFLAEEIAPYPDVQLGAAVRTIHDSCRQVLDRYLKFEPILATEEDKPVTIEAGFDPGTIKLVGNLKGEPPIRGILRHKGWRVKEANLPPLANESGRMVLAPAEVEIP
jgi:Domain of unknown function (DUF2760)